MAAPPTHAGPNRPSLRAGDPVHLDSTRQVPLTSKPIIRAAESSHGRILLAATSGEQHVLVLQGERVANPDFYPMLKAWV
jgi:hypothetical protein